MLLQRNLKYDDCKGLMKMREKKLCISFSSQSSLKMLYAQAFIKCTLYYSEIILYFFFPSIV